MFSSSTFKDMLHNTSLYQQQTIYDLNSLLNDSSSTYGIDNFDLSLLGSDYTFDNYQQLKVEDLNDSASNLALSIEIDNNYQSTSLQLKQEDTHDWQQHQYYLQSSSLISPISPATTTHSSPSPCPSVEYPVSIKQEYPIVLPPSPPDSNGVPSPQSNFKIEQFDDNYQTVLSPNSGENFIDINYLLDGENNREQKQQDHQVLRGFLQDTSFQRKHNLKPLPLENLFGGLSQRGDIEPVISLALQHAKQEVQATCSALKISPNPQEWTKEQVQLWINSTIKQFRLESLPKCEVIFPENGQMLAMLSDEEFIRRAPQIGSILHAQLEIWKAAYGDVASNIDNSALTSSAGPSSAVPTALSQTSIWNQMLHDDSEMSDDDDSEAGLEIDMQALVQKTESVGPTCDGNGESSTSQPSTPATGKAKVPKKHPTHLQKKGAGGQSSHIHLWQFLKELLASPQTHGTAIRWLDRSKGIFKIEDSVRVARLWGRRKNRPAMNYDKLSRSIRQYYKKGIMKKTERSQRLVYQFCHPYYL